MLRNYIITVRVEGGIDMSSVEPRKGVTKGEVFAACTAIFSEGKSVTNQRVRLYLGRGSYTTIAKYIREWKVESKDDLFPDSSDIELPPEVLQMARHFYTLALSTAQELENSDRVQSLERENESYRDKLSELEGAKEELSGLRYAYDGLSKQVESLARENENLKQGLSPEVAPKVEGLRAEVSEKELRIGELELEKEEHRERLEEQTERVSRLEERIETLTSEKTTVESEARTLRVELEGVKPELEQTKDRVEALKAENEKLLVEVNRLKAESKSTYIEVDPPNVSHLEAKFEEAAKRIEVLESENESLKSQLYLSGLSKSGEDEKQSDVSVESPPVELTQSALAKRLGVSASTVKRHYGDLTEWSKGKDPDGTGWIKRGDKFIPHE